MVTEKRLHPSRVKALLARILATGVLSFSRHAYDEMKNDKLSELDVRNTLKGGAPQPGELVSGSWRYRVFTLRILRMAAVVAFRSETCATVVTAWRLKKK